MSVSEGILSEEKVAELRDRFQKKPRKKLTLEEKREKDRIRQANKRARDKQKESADIEREAEADQDALEAFWLRNRNVEGPTRIDSLEQRQERVFQLQSAMQEIEDGTTDQQRMETLASEVKKDVETHGTVDLECERSRFWVNPSSLSHLVKRGDATSVYVKLGIFTGISNWRWYRWREWLESERAWFRSHPEPQPTEPDTTEVVAVPEGRHDVPESELEPKYFWSAQLSG
jgi:hypothetical protein